MGPDEEATETKTSDPGELEDLEASDEEAVAGGLKMEQDVIEYKSNTPDGKYM